MAGLDKEEIVEPEVPEYVPQPGDAFDFPEWDARK